MTILELKIDELKPYANNPRDNTNAVDAVAASIKEFGFKVPIVIDKDNVIIAGHTRLMAAEQLGLEKVPCIVADDLTPEQVKAFRVADNKTAEIAEWDMELLEQELAELQELDFDMEQFGFENFDDEEEKEIIEDDVPEVDEESDPVAQLGDIWQLGRHRLMCGDSTDVLNIDLLMDGQKADLVFTDPPYGMKKEADGVLNDNLNYDDLLTFNKQWIPLTFEALKENGSWYCWGIDEPLMDIYAFILKPMQKANKITFRNFLTWYKGSGMGQLSEEFRQYARATEKCLFVMCGVCGFNTNSDNFYEGFEPLRVFLLNEWRKISEKNDWDKRLGNFMGKHWFSKSQWDLPTEEQYKKLQAVGAEYGAFVKPYKELRAEYEKIKYGYDDVKQGFYSGRAYFDNVHDNMNDVWQFSRTSQEERELTGGHATPKPIALCSRAIKSSSREGETVLDVFGGSGSTLIACEQLNRKCRMMELDPKYCDVIIKRWETLTGEKAVKIN